MTVKELIEELKKFDGSLEVRINSAPDEYGPAEIRLVTNLAELPIIIIEA